LTVASAVALIEHRGFLYGFNEMRENGGDIRFACLEAQTLAKKP